MGEASLNKILKTNSNGQSIKLVYAHAFYSPSCLSVVIMSLIPKCRKVSAIQQSANVHSKLIMYVHK